MSTLVISDLSFLQDLDNQESKVAGAASAGAAAAADYDDAVAASGSTTRGSVYANANGTYRDYSYYGYYESGPSANVSASDRHYYY